MKRWMTAAVAAIGIAVSFSACSDELTNAENAVANDQWSVEEADSTGSELEPPNLVLGASMRVAWPVRGESMGDWYGDEGERTNGGTIYSCGKWINSHSGADYYARDLRRVDGSTLNRRVHAGIDGEVVKAGWTDCYGNQVVIYDSARRVAVRYAHLNTTYVGVGARVRVNDMIGRMGNTGCGQFGEHLHMVAYENVDRNSIPYVCDSTYYACRIDFYYP